MAEIGLVRFGKCALAIATAEVRLQEHRELRMALGLKQTPDYNTFYRFMRRLRAEQIQMALQETALAMMKDGPTKRAVFAVDATGLAPGAMGTFFINRKRDRGEGLPWRCLAI